MERRLVVNADDFGLSDGINRGIIRAHADGIVTSASLMVRQGAAEDAADRAGAAPRMSIGLHVDLGEWSFGDGEWRALYEVVSMEDPVAVEDEVSRQLACFRGLVGREPTHLDSHQHVHRKQPVASILSDLGRRLGIPLRHYSERVSYCGSFYGQSETGVPRPAAISAEHLVEIIRSLPPGTTELACHPGEAYDLTTMYRLERSVEIDSLCDPMVREAIRSERVELCSFAEAAARRSDLQP